MNDQASESGSMMKIAILDDYQRAALSMADWCGLRPHCDITTFNDPMRSIDHASELLHDFNVVCAMRERMAFPGELIRRLPNLRLLCTTGTRNSFIDLGAATERSVLVCHTHSADTEFPTSELTWALILACLRNLPLEDRRIRAGEWQTTIGQTLHGKTLGLVGLGRIGTRVGRIANAFGMNVQAWSPNLTPDRARSENVTYVNKHELFRTSDVVSLHLVLSDQTRGIVGKAEFGLMRRTAIIVNTSRGPLIDEPALISALASCSIGGAALDVFDQEPLAADHPLLSFDRVVLSPHIGYVTRESYRTFFRDTVENIQAFLRGRPIRLLNPSAQSMSA